MLLSCVHRQHTLEYNVSCVVLSCVHRQRDLSFIVGSQQCSISYSDAFFDEIMERNAIPTDLRELRAMFVTAVSLSTAMQ